MIEHIHVKNFKSLRDTGRLRVAPITLLMGPNSSGKSSLLQFLLMLKQTIDNQEFDVPLLANGPAVQLGNFPTFICGGNTRREIWFEVGMSGYPRGRGKKAELANLILDARFSYSDPAAQIQLRHLGYDVVDRLTISVDRRRRGAYDLTLRRRARGRPPRKVPVRPIGFHRFGVRATTRANYAAVDSPEVWNTGLYTQRVLTQIFSLGALRDYPQRVYLSEGLRPTDVGPRGERTVDALWLAYRKGTDRFTRIRAKVEHWFREFGFADRLKIERLGTENIFRVILTDPPQNIDVSLPDVGFGASQTLPIVVESFLAPPGSTVLVEQPEIHLHPRAQATLGDLFIDAAGGGARHFIIETHSEHLLARIRRRMAEGASGKLRDSVAIYYFEPTASGTRVQEVALNRLGQYERIPDGFFAEDIAESFAHLSAITSKHRK